MTYYASSGTLNLAKLKLDNQATRLVTDVIACCLYEIIFMQT